MNINEKFYVNHFRFSYEILNIHSFEDLLNLVLKVDSGMINNCCEGQKAHS
jgi:hypothetical protein